MPLGVFIAVLISSVIVPALCMGLQLPRRLGLAWAWRRLKPRLLGLSLMAKLKILTSFYQICTNIQVRPRHMPNPSKPATTPSSDKLVLPLRRAGGVSRAVSGKRGSHP